MKEKFISGIYNYCDRWCERCDFTARCRNYETTGNLSPEQKDINNEVFWKTLASNFKLTIELIQKAAKERGIDLSTPLTKEEEWEYKKSEDLLRSKTNQHPLIQFCKQYQSLVRSFFENTDGFVNKAKELVNHLHLGMKSEEDVGKSMADIEDCIDIIQWYKFFIDAKLQRALRGKIEGEEWEIENGFQKDSDGSAKIALIGIERSMAAWAKLYDQLPSSEDVSLKVLALLSQLKDITLREFPKAMKFKRAGFDD